jgi:hypothetical protein
MSVRDEHGHGCLWIAVVFVALGFFHSCDADYESLKRDNADLRGRVERLERGR